MKTQTNRSQPVFTKNRVTMNYAKLQMTQRSSTWMYLTADDDSEAISQLFNKNPLNLLFSLTLKWLLMAFFWLKRNWVARVSWLKFSPHAFKLRKKKKVSIAFHIKSSRVKWSFHPSILYLFLEKPQNSLLKPRVLSLFFFYRRLPTQFSKKWSDFLDLNLFFPSEWQSKGFSTFKDKHGLFVSRGMAEPPTNKHEIHSKNTFSVDLYSTRVLSLQHRQSKA